MAQPKRRSLAERNKDAISREEAPVQPVAVKEPEAPAEAPQPAPAAPPAKATPAAQKTPAPTASASEVTRIGIYLTPEQFTGAKAAYLADWINGGEANTFTRWIGEVLSAHAERTPQERLERSTLRDRSTERIGSSRSFNVPTAAVEQMRAAITADHGVGRWPSDSAWCAEAIDLATEAAKEKNGGTLPTPPVRLPNRLSR
jgi:hypothetical protein